MKTNEWIYLIIVIVIVFFGSCKTQKKVSNIIKKDSIVASKIVTITPSQLNELVIDNPCDSLGNLKQFYYKTSSGNAITEIKSVNDTIFVSQNIDSLKQVWEREFISNYNFEKKVMIEEIEVLPWWLKLLLCYTLALTFFVIIRYKKTIFQILIKLLKFFKIIPI